jgi:hypothetical protein
LVVAGYSYTSASLIADTKDMPEEEEQPDPPRNFTAKQLRYFNGEKEDKGDDLKPVYLSVNGTVFDVSDGRNFYGPDGTLEWRTQILIVSVPSLNLTSLFLE